MRLIFAGTPEFAVPPLHALIEHHDVVAVFTQPDRPAGRGKKLMPPPVKQVALEHGIPVHQPLSLKDQVEVIENYQADVMVVVAYGMLLPQSILDLPKFGCLNIHASLLPRWRGAAPIQRAIQAGDSETGVAIMQMEAGLDTGPVFETLTTRIDTADTSASLHDRLSKLGAQGIVSTISKLIAGSGFTAQTQDDSAATYAHKISKAEAAIDWSQSSESLHNQIRAFIPWPVCETFQGQNRIRVWQSSIESVSETVGEPGTIVAIDDAIQIACGQGTLLLHRLQRDGGKAVDAHEFCNGYALDVGMRLHAKDHG